MNFCVPFYFVNCFFFVLQILRYPMSIGATQRRFDKKMFIDKTQSEKTEFTNVNAATSKTNAERKFLEFLQIENMQSDYDRNKNPKEIQALADERLALARIKRRIAKIIRRAAELAMNDNKSLSKDNDDNTSCNNENSNATRVSNRMYQATMNEVTAKILDFDADSLERENERRKSLLNGTKIDSAGVPVCKTIKIGPLEIAPMPDELRHRISQSVIGQLIGSTFTIFQNKKPKVTYDTTSIDLPIINIPNTGDACWGFYYHGQKQIFCAANEVTRNSWMNAITEAWFCLNEGLQGSLPSIEDIEKDMASKDSLLEEKTKKEKGHSTANNFTRPNVDIDITMNNDNTPNVTINGNPISRE